MTDIIIARVIDREQVPLHRRMTWSGLRMRKDNTFGGLFWRRRRHWRPEENTFKGGGVKWRGQA